MARRPRLRSESDVYHIVLRGVSRQIIFEDDEDRMRFLDYVVRFKNIVHCELFAWCLMDNHVHMLLKIDYKDLSKLVKTISSTYAAYFNKKYERAGHLFQARFKSEPVDTDSYLLSVVRYIHHNPQKAGIAPYDRYPWSSYSEYTGSEFLISKKFVLSVYGDLAAFIDFHSINVGKSDGANSCLDIDEMACQTSDKSVINEVRELYGDRWLKEIIQLSRIDRNKRLIQLSDRGLSVRQIERLTGVSHGVVGRVVQAKWDSGV